MYKTITIKIINIRLIQILLHVLILKLIIKIFESHIFYMTEHLFLLVFLIIFFILKNVHIYM